MSLVTKNVTVIKYDSYSFLPQVLFSKQYYVYSYITFYVNFTKTYLSWPHYSPQNPTFYVSDTNYNFVKIQRVSQRQISKYQIVAQAAASDLVQSSKKKSKRNAWSSSWLDHQAADCEHYYVSLLISKYSHASIDVNLRSFTTNMLTSFCWVKSKRTAEKERCISEG